MKGLIFDMIGDEQLLAQIKKKMQDKFFVLYIIVDFIRVD